ncbi:unnamed protein product [Brassica napus]|uniref:(rape) hypothetical protein n=1 Tax=Brassica napus TaxID=3708 RepID=A0A816TRS9_BRANA|nr:unnamed protein product [Brassica napus]
MFSFSFLQLVLLFLAIVSVPCMLLSKPCILKKQHEAKQQGQSYAPLEETYESLHVETSGGSDGHGYVVSASVFSHHRILCLELFPTPLLTYVYGLSVLHTQISSVFYEKVLLLAWGIRIVTPPDHPRPDQPGTSRKRYKG